MPHFIGSASRVRGSFHLPVRAHGLVGIQQVARPSGSFREVAGRGSPRRALSQVCHRRAPHLACAGRARQGAGRHAAAGHGQSPRPCRPLRRSRRRPRGRRRNRDVADTTFCVPCHADGRRALGQPPCRRSSPAGAAVDSTSPATPMPRATWLSRRWPDVQKRRASRPWACLRGQAISTSTTAQRRRSMRPWPLSTVSCEFAPVAKSRTLD